LELNLAEATRSAGIKQEEKGAEK